MLWIFVSSLVTKSITFPIILKPRKKNFNLEMKNKILANFRYENHIWSKIYYYVILKLCENYMENFYPLNYF